MFKNLITKNRVKTVLYPQFSHTDKLIKQSPLEQFYCLIISTYYHILIFRSNIFVVMFLLGFQNDSSIF